MPRSAACSSSGRCRPRPAREAEAKPNYGDTLPIASISGMPHDVRVARLGRIIAAGFPHHVTQRGNRRQTIFFEPADYALYRDLLAERCRKASVAVWAYCLMPNLVHLVLTPAPPESLGRAIGETHRQYTGFINARARWTGHLFQGRFSSVALDEAYLVAAVRY